MKTTHQLLSSLILLFISFTNAQCNKSIKGNGKVTTDIRWFKRYNIISVHSSMVVSLVGGSEGIITFKAEENIL